jgi:hypothetical protein
VDLYIHSPICLHGVMLNYLSTGTTLPCFLYRRMKRRGFVSAVAYIKYFIDCYTSCTFTVYLFVIVPSASLNLIIPMNEKFRRVLKKMATL